MDNVSKKKRSEIMSKIRSKRTGPEMYVHGWLKGNRVRHRMWPDMPGNPDVIILDEDIAVFVNGCFWHGCGRHFKLPKINRKFWREKIDRNIVRQRSSFRRLRARGFTPVVVWEHDLDKIKKIVCRK